MKTKSTKNKVLAALGAAAVTVVAPTAALLAVAGTAQADDVCTGPYSQGYSDGVFGGPGKCFLDPAEAILDMTQVSPTARPGGPRIRRLPSQPCLLRTPGRYRRHR